MECTGSEIVKPTTNDIEVCAQSCKGVASMFAFGTNDFGRPRCNVDKWQNGCACYCETAAMPDGTCSMASHNGLRLYKYEKGEF